ncbi:MAG TPA: transaldolase family protein [Candidatus Sulfotelmatobacter sp.]|nr:transaldolase family protein [Candidatus Sulfotelmatobacter sp.]
MTVTEVKAATASPLARMVSETPTDYWNDSCAVDDLEYAVARGATGATSNPTIVLEVLHREKARWIPRLRELVAAHPAWTEVELTWALVEEMAVRGAAVLEPVFRATGGHKGRLSLQTNPANYRDADRMLEQGLRFAGLAPNMQVKFPATSAGLQAIERATAAGVNINATVSFTVPQALAVAEAVERGLDAAAAAGLDTAAMSPVCTMMIGRLDDWMRVLAERDSIAVDPDALDWAGIAAFKRAVGLYHERGFRTRLLAAAYRHRLHWTELVGGDVILTMPHAWQVRFNESGLEPRPRIDVPVDPDLVADLTARIPDFGRAYEPDGLSIAEFDGYGATVRTLRGFIRSYHDLVAAVRDVMLPDPDVRPA